MVESRFSNAVEMLVDGYRSATLELPQGHRTRLSHLWSDGLGNPNGNSIPLCQLERLFRAISESNYAVARHGPRLDTSKGHRPQTLEQLGGLLRSLYRLSVGLRPSKKPRCVYFWLDVYCVPVVDQRGLEREMLKYLHTLALNRMSTTYSWANYVLVLDHEFARLEDENDYDELASRVAVSGWNSRFWTYQEYCMARTLVFYGGDGPKLTHDIGMDGSLGWPLFGKLPDKRDSQLCDLSELSRFVFRPRTATGVRITQDEKYDERLRAANFVDVWNVLQNRNTSQPDDVLMILAMLLDS